VISDFESDKGDMIAQGTPKRSGWWYVYYPGSPSSPVKSGQAQTPAVNTSGPIAVAAAPDASTCNKYALHSTGSGFVGTSQDYAGLAGLLAQGHHWADLQPLRRQRLHWCEVQDQDWQWHRPRGLL